MKTARPLTAGLVLAVALVVAGAFAQRDFARQGDGWEYLLMVEAWVRHGSPEIRDDDITAVIDDVDGWLRATAGPTQPGAVRAVVESELAHRFITTPADERMAVHFWLYPLLAVPARLVLDLIGSPSFNALVVTNALLVGLAVSAVLLAGTGSESRRHALAALLLATPVVWYAAFTGAEVFSWTFGVLALVALDRGWAGVSACLAGLGATQNPAMAPLVLASFAVALEQRRLAPAVAAGLGATVAALPVAEHLWRFGVPAFPLAQNASVAAIAPWKVAGLLVDLNYGLLPYVPVLLLGLAFSAWRAAVEPSWRRRLLLVAVAGMMLGAQTQMNWNSAAMGLHRYLVWMLPALAWLAVDALHGTARRWFIAAAVATSGVVLVDWPAETNWLEHRPAARWMLRNAPGLYRPGFEVFAERSAHAEAPPGWMLAGRADGWRELLPTAVGHGNGAVTALLVDADSADRLRDRFQVDVAYWPELSRLAAAAATPVYLHPPPGAVRSRHDRIDGAYHAGMQAAERVRAPSVQQPSPP